MVDTSIILVPTAAEKLRAAAGIQRDVVDKLRLESGEGDDKLRAEVAVYAELNCELGEYYEKREKNLDSARNFFEDTLRVDDTHEKSLLSIAKILMAKGEYE